MTSEVGVIISKNPDTTRAFDAGFVKSETVPEGGMPDGFLAFAPELVIEVVSPFNRASDIREKVKEYQDIGVALIWVTHVTHKAPENTINYWHE